LALLLSKNDVSHLISMEEVIRIVEDVYASHGRGKIVMPPKITLDLGETGGWPHYNAYLNSMPAYVGEYDIAGVKIIGGFFENFKRKLPSIMGLIFLIDPKTGEALSILEGSLITALRTGASTAVGVKYLAKKNSSCVSIIGAGLQARFQLRALSRVMNIKQVYVSDLVPSSAQALINEISNELPNTNFVALPKASTLYDESDIIVTVSSSHEPIVEGKYLKEGTLLVALGSYKELDDECVQRASKIVIDNLEQAKHRGSLTKWLEGKNEISEKVNEICDIVIGKSSRRQSDGEIILYEPIGIGSTDVAVAYKVYQNALASGKGQRFDFL
jgi:alanine dehydrogenase